MNKEIKGNFDYIKPLEKRRRVMRNLVLMKALVLITAIPIFIVNLILFIVRLSSNKFFNINNLISFISAPLLAIMISVIITKCINKMKVLWRNKFKETLVFDRFSKIFTDANFVYNEGFSRETILASGLVRDGNRYFSEDFLCAYYKGVKFERSDVKIEQIIPVRGLFSKIIPDRKKTYFNGQWLIFDFNKKIDAYVRIFEKGLLIKKRVRYLLMPQLALLDISKTKKANNVNTQRVQFEDIEFNKKFEITTTNEQTAFYIITPYFIESVKYLEKNLYGKLMLAFSNDRLHVGLHTEENYFEPRIFKVINQDLVKEIDKQAETICNFIDILRLDNNYFKYNQ